jgi:hypothetical protein
MQNFTGPKAIGPSTLEARLAPKAMAGNMGLCMEMKPCLHITQTHPLADFQKEPTSVLDLWEPQKVNLAEPEPIVEISLFLPDWQANILESEAHSLGISLAKMLRKVLLKHLEDRAQDVLNSQKTAS